MKAILIKERLDSFTGVANLYKLEPPFTYRNQNGEVSTEYVVVSATVVPISGPETYIFASDKDGTIVDWGELTGSFRGGLDHKKALSGLGYGKERRTNENYNRR